MKAWKQWENEIIQSFKAKGFYTFKVPEAVTHVRATGKVFQRKTPFDFAACIHGIFVGFDAKYCEQNSFQVSNVKSHQLLAINDVEFYGGISGLLVYFKKHNMISWANNKCIKDHLLNHKKLAPLGAGVVSQSANLAIDPMKLIGNDLKQSVERWEKTGLKRLVSCVENTGS
jgi:penicillin-binding protein-related factor A (putative recombinase)